ncbi:MAG: OmpA family protein [Desulfuromonadales bacterium]
MKQVCRLLVSVMALVLTLSLAIPLTASAEVVKKVDNFIVLLDQSGSMVEGYGDGGQKKFNQAVDAITRLDQGVPELGYMSTVALFAPFKVVSKSTEYKNGSLGAAVAGRGLPFSDLTSIAEAFDKVDPVISGLSGKTALIVFTDGESNIGSDPVAKARSLYSKYPDLCIHIVSYANTPQGQKTIEAIRALNGCSVAADGKSLATEAAMNQFGKDVLYNDVQPAPVVVVPPPVVVAPAPAPVVAKEVITFNLFFGFDKWAITDEMVPVLEQAKLILEEDSSVKFIVSGHTDSTGPESYNQGLSERRAASVKNWLVKNGISAERLETIGYGESRTKYDNSTREGRKLNRRVELQSK